MTLAAMTDVSEHRAENPKIREWQTSFQRIFKKATYPITDVQTYRRLLEIAHKSPVAMHPNYFWRWLHNTYTVATLVNIRALCEFESPPGRGRSPKRKQTDSLHILLSDMKNNCRLLSLEQFMSHYAPADRRESDSGREARGDFERLWGKGAEHASSGVIAADLRRIKDHLTDIIRYTDKGVAHLDKNSGPDRLGTIERETFTRAISCIQELVNKYDLVLTGKCRSLLLCETTIDSLFRDPWITGD
jgi:hypothetical protein